MLIAVIIQVYRRMAYPHQSRRYCGNCGQCMPDGRLRLFYVNPIGHPSFNLKKVYKKLCL
jgi:hypothetical protein